MAQSHAQLLPTANVKAIFIVIAMLSLIHTGESLAADYAVAYTIKIAESASLDAAKDQALEIAQLVSVPIWVELDQERYVVYAGASQDLELMKTTLQQLRNAGYHTAFLDTKPVDKDSVVFSIDTGSSEKALLTIEQQRQKALVEPDGRNKRSADAAKQDQPHRYIGIGWQFYNEGKLPDAIRAFELALAIDASLVEAKYGLALAFLKSSRPHQALPLLEQLLAADYRTDTLLPQIITLLLDDQQYKRAQLYIGRLPKHKRAEWTARMERLRLERALDSALTKNDAASLAALTRRSPSLLRSCRLAGRLIKAGKVLAKAGNSVGAVEIYRNLLAHCPRSWGIRLSAFYGLKSTIDAGELAPLVKNEQARRQIPESYRSSLNQIQLHLLKDQFSALPDDAPQIRSLANKILALQPKDPGTRTRLAWWYFRQGQFLPALELFQALHDAYPKDKNYALGLTYTLAELDRIDEALSIANVYRDTDKAFTEHTAVLLSKKANTAYEAGDYTEAEKWLRRLLAIDPANRDAEQLLAWTLYKNGKTEQAIPLLESMFESDPDPQLATVIIASYEAIGNHKRAVTSARKSGKHKSAGVRGAAADYFYSQGWPTRAAQTHRAPGTPYFASRIPRFEATPLVRSRRGDRPGPSTLNEYALALSYHLPIGFGTTLSASLEPAHLTSEDGSSALFTGSFFRSALPGAQPVRRLTTSATVVTPEIALETEGSINFAARLGTTPLNGPVSPRPTFAITAQRSNWSINIQQQPVDQSLLSYVGLQDPWSTEKWGRVLRTGLELSGSHSLSKHNWVSIQGGLDHYWGTNVWGNQSYQGSIAIGATRPVAAFNVSPGLFVFLQHFDRNSNFFTFGHGGYFSPDFLIAVGPSVSFETKHSENFSLQGELSLGYVSFRTDNAPQFPLQSNPLLGTGAFQFDGESKDGLSGRTRLNGTIMINSLVAASGYFHFMKSPAFTEYGGGIILKLYFDP